MLMDPTYAALLPYSKLQTSVRRHLSLRALDTKRSAITTATTRVQLKDHIWNPVCLYYQFEINTQPWLLIKFVKW